MMVVSLDASDTIEEFEDLWEPDEIDSLKHYNLGFQMKANDLQHEVEELKNYLGEIIAVLIDQEEKYDKKCDEYLELITVNSKLRGLLADNKIEHEY